MRRRSPVRGWLLAAVAALTLTCDDPPSRMPTSPSTPMVAGVEIIGPDTLAPGQTAQYSAAVRLSDGTIKAPSPDTLVTWRSSRPNVQVGQDTGLATAAGAGEAALTAEVVTGGVRRGTKEIVVVPDGTYRLVGVISDAEYPELRIAAARVEVTPGPLVTTTGSDGTYRLYGVPPDAELSVSADGYLPVVRSLHLDRHAAEHVELSLPAPRLAISGPYTLSIDVDGPCSELSEEQRHRTYDALVTQDGFRLDVALTEPRFRLDGSGKGDRFSGTVNSTGATFQLDSFSYYYYFYYTFGYPQVAEVLSDDTILVIAGRATTTSSGAGLSGTLSGSVSRWVVESGRPPRSLGGCFSRPIRFTLTPR